MATQDKIAFLNEAKTLCTQLDTLRDKMVDWGKKYYGAQYNTSIDQAVFDECKADAPILEPMEFADIASFLNLCEQLNGFLSNAAPVQGDRNTLIAKLQDIQ